MTLVILCYVLPCIVAIAASVSKLTGNAALAIVIMLLGHLTPLAYIAFELVCTTNSIDINDWLKYILLDSVIISLSLVSFRLANNLLFWIGWSLNLTFPILILCFSIWWTYFE